MPPYRYRIPISSQPASSIIGCYSGQKPAKRRSLSTSLKPARHGVYDFWTDDAAAKAGKARSAHVLTHRKGGDAIWNMLSEYGKQMLVVNVPMTYPPGAVNGIMVSGYTMPGAHVDFTHPSTFKGELYRAVPGYQIDLDVALRKHLHVTGKFASVPEGKGLHAAL